MARKSLIGALTAAGMALAAAMPANAETLAEALTGAYTSSGLLEQNRAVLRSADEDVAGSVASLRPVLSWLSDITRTYGGARPDQHSSYVGSADTEATIALVLTATLYQGNSRILGLEASKEAVLATRSALVSVEQSVLLRGVNAFMEVRRAAETVTLTRNNVRVIREELRAARDRFEVGEVTRTDVASAEARLSAAVGNLAAAEGSLEIANEEYLASVGRRPNGLVSPANLPTIPATLDEAKARALRDHPDMIQAQHNVTAAEIGIQIARAAMKPTVTLTGTYGYVENFDSPVGSRGGIIELESTGPIYAGGAISSAVRQAMHDRDAARASLHVLGQSLQQNVANAYAQLRVARASREASAEQVRAARVAFEGVREEATLGARTTLDVLDAEQELLDARATLISSQVDETIAGYTVLYTIGQLTAESLALNVPRYDPEEYYNLVKNAPAKSAQGADLDRVLRALKKQ